METDWKKKYEEALERARKYYGGDEEDLVCIEDMLEDVFHELRESEDERIRKELLAVINDLILPDEQKARFNAWLEKKKDLDKMIVVSPEVWDTAIADAYENGKKDNEKQKEQKPVEWDELLAEFRNINEAFGKKEVVDNPERYGLSRPAEWSEEDEDKLNDILEMIKYTDELPSYDVPSCNGHLHLSNEYKEKLSSWLKSLRPQSYWKPSEEQMEALSNIVEQFKPDKELESLYNDLKKLM